MGFPETLTISSGQELLRSRLTPCWPLSQPRRGTESSFTPTPALRIPVFIGSPCINPLRTENYERIIYEKTYEAGRSVRSDGGNVQFLRERLAALRFHYLYDWFTGANSAGRQCLDAGAGDSGQRHGSRD